MKKSALAFVVLAASITFACAKSVHGGGPNTTPPTTITGISQTPTPLSIPATTAGNSPIANLAEIGGTGTGVNFSVTGNANLAISGSQLSTATSPSFVAGVNQTYSLSVTDSGGGSYSDPSPRTLIIPAGGSDILLATITCVNPVASTQTSMVCSGAIPFGSSQMDATRHLKVVDNDTSTQIDCQGDNRVTDNSGTAQRFMGWVCNTMSATASELKQLTFYSASGSETTGTDITVADMNTYIASLGKNMTVTFLNLNNGGHDYSAAMNTGLTSGNSGWINKTTPTVMTGKHRSGGGLVTEFLDYVPATFSGTPDAQMNVTFDIVCSKAGRGAANTVSNPITGCKTVAIIRNGWAQAGSAVNNYFGLCITISSACDIANFPNSALSTTITITCHSVSDCAGMGRSNQQIPASTGSSFFTVDHQGKLIDNGVGYMVVDGFTNGTTATVSAAKDLGTNTISSGTIFGTTLPYGSEVHFTGWIGFAHPQPDAEKGEVYIGSAWNGTAGGPGTYYAATGAIFNYTYTPSSFNSASYATILASMGSNPVASSAGQCGLEPCYLETTGGRDGLGVFPDYYIGAFYRWDANAANIVFNQGHRWNYMPTHYIDQTTGKQLTPCNAGSLPLCSGSKIYVLDNRFTADTIIAQPADNIQPWITDGFAHDPAGCFGALLMTADYVWNDCQQASATSAWMQPNSGTPGQGFQKSLYVSPSVCCGLQGRGTAWAQNAQFLMRQFTPDSNAALGWDQATVIQFLHYSWGGTGGPTFKTQYLADTSAGNNYWTTNGPHFFMDLISFPPWQSSFAMMTLAHAREVNILDSDGMAEYNWFNSNAMQIATDPTVQGQQLSTGYYGVNHLGNTSVCPSPYVDSWTYVNTWQDYYKANALIHPDAAVLFDPRATASTATLSAVSGTNVTFQLFNDGTQPFKTHAFYVGGWVESNDGGRGQITSVVDDYTVTIDTTASKAYANSSSGCGMYSGAAFGSTSYSGGFYHIPNPAPADVLGTNWASNAGGFDFTDLIQRSLGFSKQYGETGAAAAYAASLGWTGGVPKNFYNIKWGFGPRSILP